MSEYIEREAAVTVPVLPKEHREYQTFNLDDAYEQGWYDALDNLVNIPAADVSPVRHGRWIEPSRLYYGAKQYECSLCYSDTFWKKHSITEKYPHCPNCGALMQGGEQDA